MIRFGKYRRKLWNDRENVEETQVEEWKVWKIPKKLWKDMNKYGRKVGWIVKWYAKYGRKLWNDMENMEENSEKIGKIWNFVHIHYKSISCTWYASSLS